MICPSCKKENSSRNYYCDYCNNHLKAVRSTHKFGKLQREYLLKLECLSEVDTVEVLGAFSHDPYIPKKAREVRRK